MPLLDGEAFVSTQVIGGKQTTITRTGQKDVNLQKDIEEKTKNKKKSVSKGDVQVTITDNKVLITYGVSVKTYSFNTSINSKTVTLVSGTPFMEAAKKLFGDQGGLRYMVNLAGGNPGSKDKNLKGYSNSELNERWDALVKEVAARNFIDVIAGFATENGPETLYLVINGQILSIINILSLLSNWVTIGPNQLDFSAQIYDPSGHSFKRSLYRDLNYWRFSGHYTKNRYANLAAGEEGGVNEAAMRRSTEASGNILAQLNQQKLTVSLTQLQNILR